VAEPLTPEEIDALLNSLKESTGPAAEVSTAPTPAANPECAPEVSAPAMPFGELSRESAEKLGHVAESFRASIERNLKPVLQLPFSVRVASLGLARPIATPLAFLKFTPDGFIGALDFDNNLATAMADRLMGGQGRPASRPAGDLERFVLSPLFDSLAESLTHGLRHQGQSVAVFSDEDAAAGAGVQISLEFDLSGLMGGIRVVLPNLFSSSETETTKAINDDWFVELGSASMTAQALLDLQVGDIVKLDRHADANLVLTCGEETFLGRPVLDGDRLLFSVASREGGS
jgi:flagellar motor switch protein FliM